MKRNRTAIRRVLAWSILFAFLFAQAAFAGKPCRFGSGSCLPTAIGTSMHENGRHPAEVCAMQTVSSQYASTASTHANMLDAVPIILVAWMVAAAGVPMRLLPRGELVRAPPSPLVVFGRLRL